MRRLKAWSLLFIMALCVMIFSGCGGSYTEDEENGSTSTDNTTDSDSTASTITNTLTGTWQFDETKGFSGKATYDKNGTSRSITLGHVTDLTISFSGIELTGDSSDLEGTAKVFYSYESSAYDFDSSVRSYDLGSVSIKSYTNESATDKTTLMGLSQISEQQWILQSTTNLTDRMTITLSSTTKRELTLQWNVNAYIPELNDSCDCVINCTLIKYSSVPYGSDSTSDESTSDDNSTSSDSTTSEDSNETFISTLTGTWQFDETSTYAGKATYESADKTEYEMHLWSVTDFTMTFSDITLSGTSPDLAGSANVIYSYKCTALDKDGNSLGVVNMNSGTGKTMTLSQLSTNKWLLESTSASNSSNVNRITITLSSSSIMTLQWNVSVYVPGLEDYCDAVIVSSFIKTSASSSDSDSTSSDSTNSSDTENTASEDKPIDEILNGTWLLNTATSATATNITTGTAMTLNPDSGLKMVFVDFSDFSDNEETGSADVYFLHKWFALNDSMLYGNFDIRSYTADNADEKTQTMTITKISDTEWRFEGRNTTDTVFVNITIVSDTEISTVWEGWAQLNSLGGYYHYEIECSYRKSSSSTDYYEDTPLSQSLITDILTGTWKLVEEGDELSAISTTLGLEDQLSLVMSTSTDITFNDIEAKGDLANKVYSADIDYSYKWEAFDLTSKIYQGTFSANKTNQTMNLIQRSDEEWRLESITAGEDAVNITITILSETEIETRWEGIAPLNSTKKYHYIFEGTFRKQ